MSHRAALDATEMAGNSFGRRMRAERERRRIALEAIAQNTKISISLLKGLEKDDVSRWPSGIFRRSFFRSYAEAIGLDADLTLQEFVERFPDPHETVAAMIGAGVPDGSRAIPSRTVLRLTLADSQPPFSRGRVLKGMSRRVAAAAWDAGTMLALALTAFIVLDSFWAPLGAAMFCYYVGSILVLGNTPGVCLFAPRLKIDDDSPRENGDDLLSDLRAEPTVLLNLDRISS